MEIQKYLDENGFLHCKVHPNASNSEIIKYEENVLYVNVAAVPDKGKANTELIRFISKEFKIAKDNIQIVRGTTNTYKILKICKDRK